MVADGRCSASSLTGTNVAAGLYSRTAAALARTTQKGPGVACGGISVSSLSCFFIWDHGAGGSHSLWPFQVVLTRANERN